MDLKDHPILYVDDERPNRVVMQHNLGDRFSLLMADSGAAALDILAQQQVAVLLTDHRMPGMTGVDLAEQVLRRYPDTVRVIITAYSDLEATIEAINRARVQRFVKKPWTKEELGAVLEDSIHSWSNGQLIKRLQGQLVELDRVTSLAIMASSVAHDLRQPLAYMEPSVELVRDEIADLLAGSLPGEVCDRLQSMLESLEDVSGGLKKFQTIANTLLKSLHAQDVSQDVLSINQVVESALALTRSVVTRRARLDIELPESPVFAMGSEGRLTQLLVNLLINASQAVSGPVADNCITLGVSARQDDVVIEVADTGSGIDAEVTEKIFRPFFTTKGTQGSGLGLAICSQIVDEMKGTISVDSTAGQGARFTVTVPRLSGESAVSHGD